MRPKAPEPAWFFECTACVYDSDEAGRLSRRAWGICPLCTEDSGRDVYMVMRPATADEIERLGRPAMKARRHA